MTLRFFSGRWWDGARFWDGEGWRDQAGRIAPQALVRGPGDGGCPVPCFTPGSLVTTGRGTLPIEALRPGDRVATRDDGLQPLVWIGQNFLGPDRLGATPDLMPIRFAAGSLGDGLPANDIVVSPQHRMLCTGDRADRLFGEPEVLVAARHLTALPGVERQPVLAVTYLHLMFERHQVIMVDGVWSESFQPGDWVAEAMDAAQRDEILAIFPELAERPAAEVYPAARRGLKRHEARLLVA